MEPGQTFGKYRIVRLVGRGGMGIVYLAEDQGLGREVALKILDRNITSEPHFEQRFRQEARTVAGFNHPNIVRINALERIGDDLVIDMEYVAGGCLADAEVAGTATLGQVVNLTRDVLLALGCCHEAGVVHRDVKPSNILVAPQGHALLSDFGLAKLLFAYQTTSLRDASSSGFFMGTPRYAPPESWDAQEPTPAWDVYSVGMILFEAAAGKTPYDAGTPLALMKQMLERPVPRLGDLAEGVSVELSEAVDAMLKRSPAERPQDAGDALELLQRAPELTSGGAGGPVTIVRAVRRPRSSSGRTSSSGRFSSGEGRFRSRFFVFLGVAAALLLALATGAYFWRLPGAPSQDQAGSVKPPIQETEPSYRVMDVADPATQTVWPRAWLMAAKERPREWTGVMWESTHLWVFEARELTDELWELHGNWCEYTDPSAQVFRHGSLEGTGRRINAQNHMLASLEFRSAQDGSLQTRSIVLYPTDSPLSDSAFLAQLQLGSHVQPLLYNEVLARNLSWLATLEDLMVARAASRVRAVFLPENATSIVVDGHLDDVAWRNAVEGNAVETELSSTAGSRYPGSLMARFDRENLYVGVRLKGQIPKAALRLVVLRHFSIPAGDSTRWDVQFGDGGKPELALFTRHGRKTPWTCEWQAASSATGDTWEAEAVVPFSSLEGDGPPADGERWRLNAVVTDKTLPDETSVGQWGATDATQVLQGAILVLDPGT